MYMYICMYILYACTPTGISLLSSSSHKPYRGRLHAFLTPSFTLEVPSQQVSSPETTLATQAHLPKETQLFTAHQIFSQKKYATSVVLYMYMYKPAYALTQIYMPLSDVLCSCLVTVCDVLHVYITCIYMYL